MKMLHACPWRGGGPLEGNVRDMSLSLLSDMHACCRLLYERHQQYRQKGETVHTHTQSSPYPSHSLTDWYFMADCSNRRFLWCRSPSQTDNTGPAGYGRASMVSEAWPQSHTRYRPSLAWPATRRLGSPPHVLCPRLLSTGSRGSSSAICLCLWQRPWLGSGGEFRCHGYLSFLNCLRIESQSPRAVPTPPSLLESRVLCVSVWDRWLSCCVAWIFTVSGRPRTTIHALLIPPSSYSPYRGCSRIAEPWRVDFHWFWRVLVTLQSRKGSFGGKNKVSWQIIMRQWPFILDNKRIGKFCYEWGQRVLGIVTLHWFLFLGW